MAENSILEKLINQWRDQATELEKMWDANIVFDAALGAARAFREAAEQLREVLEEL